MLMSHTVKHSPTQLPLRELFRPDREMLPTLASGFHVCQGILRGGALAPEDGEREREINSPTCSP